ncbi:MAG: DEAD/DEAH box helicase [Candidatus Absconditabacterales bacterium]
MTFNITEKTFNDLGLSSKTLTVIEKKGFKIPTPIQSEVIPLLLLGKKNIIGQAETGTGKTAAFGLPLIEELKHQSNIQALVLTPTRELAIQVTEEIQSFQAKNELSIVTIYGGQSYDIQNRALKRGADIIVGTPGRLIDHLKKKNINLTDIKYLIIDEADEMLNMGFIEDIEYIFKCTNDNKKVLMFSATMPKEILHVAKKYMGEYDFVSIKKDQLTTTQTDQFYIEVMERDKLEALCRIMDKEVEFYGIVFCKTKMDADHVFTKLHEKGYSVQALHGDIQQKQREIILKLFKSKKIKILVATDVAARGIDVNDITHVINFSFPQDTESYIHRIGRTGRAGKTGIAITFINPREYKSIVFLKRATNTDIKKMEVPAIKNVIEAKRQKLKTNISNIIEKGTHEKYLEMAKEILQEKEAVQVLAALLKITYPNEFNEDNYHFIEKISVSNNGKARIFLALGRKMGFYPQTLVEYLVKETKIASKDIDEVSVLDDFSFVTVPDSQSELILKTLKGKASKARPRNETGGSRGGQSKSFDRSSNRGFNKNHSSDSKPFNRYSKDSGKSFSRPYKK